MKSQLVAAGVVSAVTIVFLLQGRAAAAQAAAPAHDHSQAAAAAPAVRTGQAAAPDAPNAPDMMAKMKAGDQQLAELAAKMNAATGAEKVDAMAALLTALVDGHRTMHEMCMSHMGEMMKMMGHGRSAGGAMALPAPAK
jgi:hypothetical protein